MIDQSNNQNGKRKYLVEFVVEAQITGEDKLVEEEGSPEEVAASVKKQLEYFGLINTCIDPIEVTRVKKLVIQEVNVIDKTIIQKLGAPIYTEVLKDGDNSE